MQTVSQIEAMLKNASKQEFEALERSLQADTRKGVRAALERTKKRFEKDEAEHKRVESMFAFQQELVGEGVIIGLDEVGRGPLAGPLTVCGVVFPPEVTFIEKLNDSKQIPEPNRASVAEEVKSKALAWTVVHVEPSEIDKKGMSACLRKAFKQAVETIEAQGIVIDHILLDGNPLHLDPREVNVIKGDAKCASIAAASVVAKVTRDALMVEYDALYPEYDFASSKGYGSQKHRDAISQFGLSPIHRASFCRNFVTYEQPSLFS
ncbi:MAG: ribonuclease HII [Anaerotardibacter sp.]